MSKLQADIGRQGIVLAVAGVLLVSGIGYLGYSWWQGRSAKPSDIAPVRMSGRGANSAESEHYQQVLQQYNNKNAMQAEQDGKTYVSVMSTRDETVKPSATAKPPGPPASSASSPSPAPAVRSAAPEPPRQRTYAVDRDHDKFLDEQVQGLIANWTAQSHGLATVAKDGKDYASSLSPSQQSGPAANGNQSAVAATLVPGYELVPAILRTSVDTDESSVTEAYFPSGPYAGARVFAPGYKRLGGSVDMTFNAMSWRGRTYKIQAKPVDENTMRTSLSGEVNNRYFSRIFVPALAMGLGKAGQLYQSSGTTTIITPQGGAVVTAPEPNGKIVAGTVLGGMAQQAGNVLAQDAAAEPVKQVLVDAGTTIGVRFMAPVLSTDEVTGNKAAAYEASDATPSSSSTLQQLQQMQIAAQQAAIHQATAQQQGQVMTAIPSTAAPLPPGISPYVPRQ